MDRAKRPWPERTQSRCWMKRRPTVVRSLCAPDRGFTLIEVIVVMGILAVIAVAVFPTFISAVRISSYTDSLLISQQEATIITTYLRNDLLQAEEIRLAADGSGSYVNYQVTDVVINDDGTFSPGSEPRYYQYSLRSGSVVKVPVPSLEVGLDATTGPVWSFGGDVSSLTFSLRDADDTTGAAVLANIVIGTGDAQYSTSVTVSPRNMRSR